MQTIYIEHSAIEHERTQRIVKKLGNTDKVIIQRYGEVFNRRAQNFRLQKANPALIIAEKFDHFVLPAPEGYGIGGEKNFYFSHMLNCVYDCRYCFLQGMYQSAHYVLFVNFESFSEQIRQVSQKHADKNCYFFSGYDCDSLAFDRVTQFSEHFVPLFKQLSNSYLELRTKSVQIKSLLEQPALDNVIIAFSLTPDFMAKAIEHKAPSIVQRVEAIQKLASFGWPIGLRFDPLIYHPNYQSLYADLFQQVFSVLKEKHIHSVSLGPLRFPKNMYQAIVKLYPDEKLFAGPLSQNQNMISYHKDIEEEMEFFCRQQLKQYIPETLFFACTPEEKTCAQS